MIRRFVPCAFAVVALAGAPALAHAQSATETAAKAARSGGASKAQLNSEGNAPTPGESLATGAPAREGGSGGATAGAGRDTTRPLTLPATANPGDNATSSQSPASVFQAPAPAQPPATPRGQRRPSPPPPPGPASAGATPPEDAQRPH